MIAAIVTKATTADLTLLHGILYLVTLLPPDSPPQATSDVRRVLKLVDSYLHRNRLWLQMVVSLLSFYPVTEFTMKLAKSIRRGEPPRMPCFADELNHHRSYSVRHATASV